MKIWGLIIKATALLLIISGTAQADLNLEITGGMNVARKIAVVPFDAQNTTATDIAGVISSDLARSGKFSPIPTSSLTSMPHNINEVNIADFGGGTEAVVVGRVTKGAKAGTFIVNFELVQLTGNQAVAIAGLQATVPASKMRQYAHRMSDVIFEKLTGIKGAFNTRIAYVKTKFGTKHPYELTMADYDGANEVRLIISSQPIMSPSWSPDGKTIAYVTFENRRAEIFTLNVYTKVRTKLTSFYGLNSNPKWSPDGSKLALVLSKDGNPEIYVLNIQSKRLTRVTNNRAIDTEPSWSVDGGSLYFVSERGGNAQVYSVNLSSGVVKRVTYNGVKNLSPTAIPDGSGLIVINQSSGFKVARQDFNGNFKVLSSSTLDESPSVAPNSTMIVYSTVYGGRKGLAIVSADGRFKANLPSTGGEISSPVWSSFVAK